MSSPTTEPSFSRKRTVPDSRDDVPTSITFGDPRSQFPANLWRNADFRWLWGANTSFHTGRELAMVLFPLIGAIALNTGAFQMGIISAALTAPSLLFGMFAGAWVDRLGHHAVLTVSSLLRALAVGLVPLLWWLDLLTVPALVAIAFVSGILIIFQDLASFALLPAVVDRAQLVDANGRIAFSRSVGQSIAPPFGGAMAGIIGGPFAIALDSFSGLISAWCSHSIWKPQVKSTAVRTISIWGDSMDALRISWRNPLLRTIMGAGTINNFGGHIFLGIYVLYMTNYLGLSPFAIGLVLGVGGIGGVIGAFLAGPLARRVGIGKAIILGWLGFGSFGLPVVLAVYWPERALELVIFSEVTQWAALVIAQANQHSLRQAITPTDYQGRIAGTQRFVTNGMIPIGAFTGGVLGSLFGVHIAIIIGVIGMLLAFVWTFFSPLRRVNDPTDDSLRVVVT